jgi:tetratricopeptide (TPR) repeat protein
MAQRDRPSNSDLVYEVLRSAEQPLTFLEIFNEVNRRQPIMTRDPNATIRSALQQGKQLVSLGDGRYGYLPHLLSGSLLRVPLMEKQPAGSPLIFPDEVRQALWPSFFENSKHRDRRPVHVELPGGEEFAAPLDFFGAGVWGSRLSTELRNYLAQSGAAAGDSLLMRVTHGEESRAAVWLEYRRQRNETAVRKRNQELADSAVQILHRSRWREVPIWDLVIALLGRGAYRADIAPDPLETVLKADRRFVDAGLNMWLLTEAVTPDVLALISQRKEAEPGLRGIQDEIPASEAVYQSDVRRSIEQTLADLGALLSQRQFGSIEEMNAFLQEPLATGGPPPRQAATPLEKAQDLIYDAWEAARPRDRVRMAKQALTISPDCADAYVLLAEDTARSPQEAADLYAKGVAAGERALGKKAFVRDVGSFWLILETRPYMRARFGLADAFWTMGDRRQAIGHALDLLRLNPGDNQGVRYVLLGWLLAAGEDAQAKKLLHRYAGGASAMWRYGEALYTFRTEGDSEEALLSLITALSANRHVPAYLLGHKRLPRVLPDTMAWGEESEAVVCVDEQLAAWQGTPGALLWLQAHLGPA